MTLYKKLKTREKKANFNFPAPVQPLSTFRPSESDVEMFRRVDNVQRISQAIKMDPRLPEEQKESLLGITASPDGLLSLLTGATGGYLARTLAHYLKLDDNSKLLLSLAGFGVGSIMYKQLGADQSHLAKQDHQTGVHQILFNHTR